MAVRTAIWPTPPLLHARINLRIAGRLSNRDAAECVKHRDNKCVQSHATLCDVLRMQRQEGRERGIPKTASVSVTYRDRERGVQRKDIGCVDCVHDEQT